MSVVQAEDALARGYEALAAGDWLGARAAFEEAVAGEVRSATA